VVDLVAPANAGRRVDRKKFAIDAFHIHHVRDIGQHHAHDAVAQAYGYKEE
jgi:hypothetical protein